MKEILVKLTPASPNILRTSRALLATPLQQPTLEEVREQVKSHRKHASEEIFRMQRDRREK